MSHIVTETPVYTATITVPDPGEQIKAADVETAVQPLANRATNHEAYGFWSSVKKALGNTLIYRLSGSAGIELLGAGCYILGTISELRGAWSIIATMSFTNFVRFSGTGARTKWRVTNCPDSDSDITTAADVYFLPNTTAASRTRTVKTTGSFAPEDGEVIRVVRTRPTGSFPALITESVVSQSGQNLFLFGIGFHGFVELTYRSSILDWVPTGWYVVDGASLAGTGLYGN